MAMCCGDTGAGDRIPIFLTEFIYSLWCINPMARFFFFGNSKLIVNTYQSVYLKNIPMDQQEPETKAHFNLELDLTAVL